MQTRAGSGGRHREILRASTLFRGLTPGQVDELAAVWVERTWEPGEYLLREGQPDDFVYVLLEGRAALIKATSLGATPSRIGELQVGDTLGEVKIVDRQPSSASAVAVTRVTATAIDLDVFDREAMAEARATVWRNAGEILAERLRRTSSTGADAIQRELAESQQRVYAGRFFLFVFCTIAGLQLAFSAVALIPAGRRLTVNVQSFLLIVWTAIPVALSLRQSPIPREAYGLTLRGAWAHSRQALAWTIPLLLALLLLKLASVHWLPSMAGRPLFDPAAVLPGRPFDGWLYALFVLMYGIHSPLQEFVGRAVLQGSIQYFLRVPPGRVDWKIVAMSSLLFASSHVIAGFWLAAATFLPGLFWGWMFARQRSLVGVSVSHVIAGWWAFFALGLQAGVE